MTAAKIPLSGKLEKHSIGAVLRAVLRGKKDGCLTVSRGESTRRIYLRGGMIVYGSSSERRDRLGEVLIAQGKLTRVEHRKYWKRSQEENRLLGITLVLNGLITQNDLYQGVTAQVATIFDRLQKWRKGEYEFVEGEAPSEGTVLLRIPLALYLRGESARESSGGKRAVEAKAARPKDGKAATGGKPGGRKKRPAMEPPADETGVAAAAPPLPEPEPAPDEAAAEEQEITILDEPEDAPVPTSEEIAAQVLIGEISFTVGELGKRIGQGPAAVLGISGEADRAVAQEAHHRLVKTLHPDHRPAGLSSELAREADEALRTVNGAFETLEARARAVPPRAEFASPQGRVRGTPAAGNEAARQFREGRDLIARRSYAQAASSLRQAVRLAPREAGYRQYLGLALMQIKRLHEAEEHLLEAVRLEPENAVHHLSLARIYSAGRLLRKARESYERVLKLDPRNTHAREELLALPEEQPAAKKNGGSLLRKLFGRD